MVLNYQEGKKAMEKKGDNKEIEKSKSHIIVQIIEYIPDSLLSKTILKKSTGNVTVSSLDEGVELEEKHLPFDVYIQIIDGGAELTIDNKVFQLKLGEGIVVPAHARHHFSAKEQFKMVSTTIKSGYE